MEDNLIVGKLTFYDSGEEMQYFSSESYLDPLRNELNSNMGGFKYETLVNDPKLQKDVDDHIYGAFGEDNPTSLNAYRERVRKEKGSGDFSKDTTKININDRSINNTDKEFKIEDLKIMQEQKKSLSNYSYQIIDDKPFLKTYLNENTEEKAEYLKTNEVKYNNQTPNIMENNKAFDQVEYLKNQLKYLGFGEDSALHKDLEKGIESVKQQFEIKTTSDKTLPGNKVDFTLIFNKSEKGGVFLNSYNGKLTNEKSAEISHNFPVNRENTFTAKEAVNLLEGRTVKIEFNNPKTEQLEPAFVKLNFDEPKTEKGNYNFQNFYKNYGVDTAQIVEKSNLIFDKPEYKESTIRSLEKGNVVKVKFTLEDKIMEGKAVLNPQYKNLNLYDSDMNRINTNKPLEGLEQDNKQEKNNVKEQSIKR